MSLLSWIIDASFSVRLTTALLHFVWQGCCGGFLVYVGGVMLRHASSQWRYNFHVAALFIMAACLPVTFYLQPIPQSVPARDSGQRSMSEPDLFAALALSSPKSTDAEVVIESEVSPANAAGRPTGTPRLTEPSNTLVNHSTDDQAPGPFDGKDGRNDRFEKLAPWITLLYLISVGLILCRLLRGVWGGYQLRKCSRAIDDSTILDMIARQSQRLGLKFTPAIAWCEQISIPVVVGIMKPMILLPVAVASGLTLYQLQALMLHELAHIRRFDPIVNLLQRIIEAVLFFHPVVWLVSRRISIEREHVADDIVLAAGWDRPNYADALVRMAELSSGAAGPRVAHQVALIGACGTSPSEFKRRVLRLLDDSNPPDFRLSRRGVFAAALAVICLFTTMMLVPAGAQVGADLAASDPMNGWRPSSSDTQVGAALPDSTVATETPNRQPENKAGQEQGANASETGSKADETETEAAALLSVIPENDPPRRAEALVTLARAKDRQGHRTAVLKLLELAEKISLEMVIEGVDQSGFPKSWGQSGALLQVCSMRARLEGTAAALARVEKIPAPHDRVIALCDIAQLQATAHDLGAARKTLAIGLATARQVPDIPEQLVPRFVSRQAHRSMSYQRVVDMNGRIGDVDTALTVIEEMAKADQPADCWGAFHDLLASQIVAGNDPDRDRVVAAIVRLDQAARKKPEEPVLDVERISRDASIAACQQLIKKNDLTRVEQLIANLKRLKSGGDDSWELDALIVQVAMQRVNAPQSVSLLPSAKDFEHQISFLKFTALHGRELARKGERTRAIKLFNTVIAEAKALAANEQPVEALIFTAQGHAILNNNPQALAAADLIDPTPSSYVTPESMEFYGLPYQPITCRATALGLIATAQHERGNLDAALATLKNIAIEKTPDGKATSWYLERVKAHALADLANRLCRQGQRDQARALADSAETAEIRVTIMGQLNVEQDLPQPGNHLKPATGASASTSILPGSRMIPIQNQDGRQDLLKAMIAEPTLAKLKQLLAGAGKEQPEPVELLDAGRRRQKNEGSKVNVIGSGRDQFALVSARVRPVIGPAGGVIESDPTLLPECAFIFDMQGRLLDTIGGHIGRTKPNSPSPDNIDIVSLGPTEDWFVRVMHFEVHGEFEYLTEYHRIANPAVKSLRYSHYANSNAWSWGPERFSRFGTLYFDFPKVADKLGPGAISSTLDGVGVNPIITWDGDRNRFFGVAAQRAKWKHLFHVDTDWSRDFQPLVPKPDQIVVSGGARDEEHWHSWQTVVSERLEVFVTLTIPQRTGPSKVIRRNCPPGAVYLTLHDQPDGNAAASSVTLYIGKETEEFELPQPFGDRPAIHAPIVQILNRGESARLLERPLKLSSNAFTFEIAVQQPGKSGPND